MFIIDCAFYFNVKLNCKCNQKHLYCFPMKKYNIFISRTEMFFLYFKSNEILPSRILWSTFSIQIGLT
jgi:hypothetical protein